MSKPTALFAVSGLVIGLLSMPALAKTRATAVIIRGTASAPTPGPCSVGYADQCLGTTPSTSCECSLITGASVSGTGFSKGSTADVAFTLDKDAATNPRRSCTPAFGSATLTNPKTGLTVTVNISATTCSPLTSNHIDEIVGGWGIESASDEATGFGLAAGTLDKSTSAVKLKLSGPVTTP